MLSTSTMRTTFVDSNNEEVNLLDLPSTFVEHQELIESLSKGYIPKALKLFVSLSAIITPDDYKHLGPLLWEHCLDLNVGSSSTTSVSPFRPVPLPTEVDCIDRLVSC